ncbi:MAG: hypothetical protein WBG96_17510 [Thermoanaerobaculia bacterium]
MKSFAVGGLVILRIRQIAKWGAVALAAVVVLFGLYLSVFFFPYPLFPHHAELSGFSVYSDREIPEDFELVLDDARRRVEAMKLYRGAKPPRLFICRSQERFVFFIRLAGKSHAGQALVISAAGNVFLSEAGIESIGQRNGGRPLHSRLQGSWSAAIAHEVAHLQMGSAIKARGEGDLAPWKSEGYADYAANLAAAASDPDYDLRNRIGLLLDDNSWRPPVESFDRRHFRWHLLVEFLCSVRGLTFTDLMDEGVTEERAWAEMMAWYASLDS